MFKNVMLVALMSASVMSAEGRSHKGRHHHGHKHSHKVGHKHAYKARPMKNDVSDVHNRLGRASAHLERMKAEHHPLELGAKRNISAHVMHFKADLADKIGLSEKAAELRTKAHKSMAHNSMGLALTHKAAHRYSFGFDVDAAKRAHPASEKHGPVTSDHRDVHSELHMASRHLKMLSGAELTDDKVRALNSKANSMLNLVHRVPTVAIA